MKTKKQLLVLLMGVGLTTQVTAQSVTEKWAATYDGNAGRSDKALAMVIDDNKNTYVTGKSYNGSNYDYVTVKYNSKGAEQWAATYNGTANGDDEAIAITVDDYGNVYVTGKSYNASSTPYSCEELTQCQLEDAAQSLGWVLSAVDAEGWVMLVDVAFEMCQDGVQDGAVCFENLNYDYATIKYNSLGVEQWVATYNGTGNANDYAKDLVVDNSGNVYVTGNSYGSGTLYDWATVKYNANGVEQWEIRKNGYNNGNDGVSAMVLDNSGNIYVTGQSDGLTLTLKYNANGKALSCDAGPHGVQGLYVVALHASLFRTRTGSQ
ncbi:MAG: SBBP repeat-containing protein [Nitrospinae bacterium]|nr:SBBP repeat-containing protein [Nitrospinota bacterium]